MRSWLTRSIVAADHKPVYPKRRLERWQVTRKKKTLPDDYPHTLDLYNQTLRRLDRTAPCQRPQLRVPDLEVDHAALFSDKVPSVLIAPGAAHPNKAWPTERFADLVRGLHRSQNVQCLWVTVSSDDGRYALPEFTEGERVVELKDLELPQLAAVAAATDLVIANDSGVGHLASAVGTPLVSIFGPTHPVLGFAPRGLRDRVEQVDEFCRPCSLHGKRPCYREERFCFTKILPDRVVAAASEILAETQGLRPALFVDRDGTLIHNKHYLSDPEGVELIDGAAAALREAKALGLAVVIVSNQSGVARGYHDIDAVERVNGRMLELLAAEGVQPDGVYFCPHHARYGKVPEFTRDCTCRKPAPGMAETAALELGLDLRRSTVVGDSPADIDLGRVIGGKAILVRTGYGTETEKERCNELERDRVVVVEDLAGAVRRLHR
jgi:histidinol-phosphate phosphatase family protein